MKRIILALAVGLFALPLVPKATGADISIDFFYDNLSGGNWIDVGDYGYCWQPDVAVSDSGWRPYTDGYWAYTDVGWTWISYEDFGWATYHYGRWTQLADYGWVWVPGSDLDWGPAWVSWRVGEDYVGWAPLPPEGPEVVYEGRPITGQVDIEFDIGPAYYNFIDVRYMGEPVLRNRIIDVHQNVAYIDRTVNVTNITYKDKIVYNYGPDLNFVDQHSSRPIQHLHLERQQNVDMNTAIKGGAVTKVQGQNLVVAAPLQIKKAPKNQAPKKVKAKVAQPKLERGWSEVGGQKEQAELKQKIKSQDLKKIPPPTGGAGRAAAANSPGASASPNAAGSPGEKGERARRGAQAGGNAANTPPAASPAERNRGRRGENTPGQQASPEATKTPGATNEPGHGRNRGNRNENTGASPVPSEANTNPETERPGQRRGRRNERTVETPSPRPNTSSNAGAENQRSRPHQGSQGENSRSQPSGPESTNPPGATPESEHAGRHRENTGGPSSAEQVNPSTGTSQPERAGRGGQGGNEPTAPAGGGERPSKHEAKSKGEKSSPAPTP